MNANPETKGEMPDMPADLKRERKPATPQVDAIPGTAPLGVKPETKAEPTKLEQADQAAAVEQTATKAAGEAVKAKHKQAAFRKPKATKAAKAKPAREPKAKATKPAHKPTEMQRTDANPARSIVPPSFKARYAENDDSNGDRVAKALAAHVRGVNAEGRPATDLKKLRAVALENGIDFKRYEGLNPGQQRMNVGNRLRGIVKAGKSVTIGGKVVAKLAPAPAAAEKVAEKAA